MHSHNEAAARRAHSSNGSSGISKSATLYRYRSPSNISTEEDDTFVSFGVAAALVIGKLARRYGLSETRAKLVAELADLKGGLE